MTFKATASDNRVTVLAAGLLLTSLGLRLQWADRRNLHLVGVIAPPLARLARLAMGAFYGLLAVGVTVLWIMAIIQWEGLAWRPGVLTLAWLTVVLPSWKAAARRTLHFQAEHPAIDADEETGLASAAGLTAFVGSQTLNLGPNFATDWDSIRMVLRCSPRSP